jgi:hypothetical protein
LLQAIRDRIEQLETTHATIEAVSGLQSGYLSKITSDPPPKRMSMWTALLLLESLGLQVSLSIAPDFTERFAHRLERRKLVRTKARKARTSSSPDFLRWRSKLGGNARAMLPDLSAINRRAAMTRWRRAREAQQSAAQ